nr:reverse transcriptase domain-containing protein [Tanacetum cinerariifolium]
MSGEDDGESWVRWRVAGRVGRNVLQILPIIAKKVHQEKVQQEKLKAVKARLNFKESPRHSESGTPSRRRVLKERLEPRHAHSRFESPDPRRGHSKSPKERGPKRKMVFKRLEKGVFHRLEDKGKNGEGSAGGHWKSRLERQKLSMEDDLSQPWVYEETDPFTPRISYFDFPKTRMPSHIKTYDGSEDPEDHLKIFQATAKIERKSASEIRLKSTTSSKEMRNPQKNSCEEAGQKQNLKKGNFRNQQRTERRKDGFTLLTKTPKEILALDKGKFKPPPPMTTPIEKRNGSKFCEFYGEVGHTTDECMHLKWKIEEMLKAVNKKDPGNSIHGLRNVKIPSDGRNGHITEQQDYSALMHNGFRTGDTAACDRLSREEKIQIAIHPEYPKQTKAIGSMLTEEGRKELCGLLRRNLDIFSWKLANMTRVS